MMMTAARTREIISFGQFELVASERLLTKGGAPVELSGRALDILIALASRPNEIISKKELLAQAWPDVIVDEGSLRFHVASLRKVLGDGKDGARYITTLAGRGYCLVAPIARSTKPAGEQVEVSSGFPHANLPALLSRMIGRSDDVLTLSTRLVDARFVTIVGAGGVGKTTVAIAVGHNLLRAFADTVLFVDFGMLTDPSLVAATIASMLGLSVQSDDAMPSLLAYLRNKRILLILDTCEHLIEVVADLASRIFTAAPRAHILATSREALRVEGEHVYKLASLACPPDDGSLTASVARMFPATQLFLERAAASDARIDLSDSDVAIVSDICRKLDGVALAIELAARRVEAYGLQQTAALLDRRLTRLWPGQRTAPPRQQTLQATLDWSYGLLSPLERSVLRRLAVFVGHFTIDAALAVVSSETIDESVVFGAIDSLVAKSMVATRHVGAMIRYRLLDTTRAHALEIKVDNDDLADLPLRHAAYYRQWLEQAGIEWPTLSNGVERAPHFAGLNNVRAALEWCFGVNGNREIGIGLASAAAPVFLSMSLLTECHRWAERAILSLGEAALGGKEEMHLQGVFGLSLIFARGQTETARVALMRSLLIAEERGDVLNQVRLLGLLQQFYLRNGDFRAALSYAERCSVASESVEDPDVLAMARSVLGISLQLTGNLERARRELESAVQHQPGARPTNMNYLGFDHRSWAGIHLATTLWLQGWPAQAVDLARETVKGAAHMEHPVTLAGALNRIISIFLWTGDLERAEEHVDWLISHAQSHDLAPWRAAGRGFRGELAIRRGSAKDGVDSLRLCLAELRAAHYELLTTAFNIALVQGLRAIDRVAEGLLQLDETIGLVGAKGDECYLPELLRVKGSLLLSMSPPAHVGAEACFTQAIDLSRRQTARSWELRGATDLAALWAAQGRREDAHALLQPVLRQFVEGADTADVRAAELLLATLS